MKIPQLKKILREKRLDLALFACIDTEKQDPDMRYFSGYGDVGILAVPQKTKPFLLVPEMQLLTAKRSMVIATGVKKGTRLLDALKIRVKKYLRRKRIGIDFQETTVFLKKIFAKKLKGATFFDLSKELAALRLTKTKKELSIIRRGCRISDGILRKCLSSLPHMKTESQVRALLESETIKRGCDLAFPPIVASGRNAAEVHHSPENKPLNKGFCIIDFGVRYKGYCTDTSRTFYLGNPSPKEKEKYSLVLQIQERAIADATIGTRCGKIYDSVVRGLGQYGNLFTHGLGHGVGIKIHELPNLTLKSKDKLQEGMVFTVEPGIYRKGMGIRIEDTVLAAKGKPVVFTKFQKRLISIPWH